MASVIAELSWPEQIMLYQVRGYVLTLVGKTSAQYRNSTTVCAGLCAFLCMVSASELIAAMARREVASNRKLPGGFAGASYGSLPENTIDEQPRLCILSSVHMDGYANYFAFTDTIAETAVSRQTYQIPLTHHSLRARDLRLTMTPSGDSRTYKTTGFDFVSDFDFYCEEYMTPVHRFEAVVSHMTYIRENCG